MGNYGSVMLDTKLLLNKLHDWRVLHVPRRGNFVAYNLAKLALSLNHECLWFESFPSCINEFVFDEQDLL
jgi:hypothetical protein